MVYYSWFMCLAWTKYTTMYVTSTEPYCYYITSSNLDILAKAEIHVYVLKFTAAMISQFAASGT